MNQVMKNLEGAIQRNSADVFVENIADGDGRNHIPMVQLFQNIIGKTRSNIRRKEVAAPSSGLRQIERNGEWNISVSDNGIGIEPQ